jgi:quercetin dioxygenase-like cupin family protein
MSGTNRQEGIFPKGEKAAAAVFTGQAYVNLLLPDKDNVYNCQIYDVVFEAGRGTTGTNTPAGKGYYQERGKPAQSLQKGDVVAIPPEVEPWHGAAQDSDFTHIGISPNTQKGGAEWVGPVTDAEYREACKTA